MKIKCVKCKSTSLQGPEVERGKSSFSVLHFQCLDCGFKFSKYIPRKIK